MPLDEKTRRTLAKLAALEQQTRAAHMKAAESLRSAILDASRAATIRDVAAAAGRSTARVHQIVSGVRGAANRGAARPR